MSKMRFYALQELSNRKPLEVTAPSNKLSDYYGSHVFDRKKMQEYLPKEAYKAVTDAIEKGTPISREIADLIANGILSLTGNKYVILILMNIILLIVGTFMDPTPAVLIFTPIFLPICKTFGMHAVQFGIMVSMNLCIGTITPPVGSILFTGCKVGHVKIEQVIKGLLPYFFAILVALLLVTYIPAISMTLPTLAGLIK